MVPGFLCTQLLRSVSTCMISKFRLIFHVFSNQTRHHVSPFVASSPPLQQQKKVDGAVCFTISGDSDGHICLLQPAIVLHLHILRRENAGSDDPGSTKTIFIQAALQSNVYGDLLSDTASSVLTLNIDTRKHADLASVTLTLTLTLILNLNRTQTQTLILKVFTPFLFCFWSVLCTPPASKFWELAIHKKSALRSFRIERYLCMKSKQSIRVPCIAQAIFHSWPKRRKGSGRWPFFILM